MERNKTSGTHVEYRGTYEKFVMKTDYATEAFSKIL